MISQMFCNKGVDNLTILLHCLQLIWQGKLNFHVPAIAYAFVPISGLKKFLWGILRPLRQLMCMKNTSSSFNLPTVSS